MIARIASRVVIALVAASAGFARATVDDAQSYALEAATPWVRKGVEIRYDYARGTTFSGRPVKVSYQVFKGNRYWFFAGGSEDGVRMDVVVRDENGQALSGTTSQGTNSATFHFTAPRTMLVSIEVTGTIKPAQAFGWALVYGFQSKTAATTTEPPPPVAKPE
jgi:hypothetical protein